MPRPRKQRGYTAGQVAKATRVNYHRIDYLDKRGIVVPSVVRPEGSGGCRVYSEADAIAIAAISRLREIGVKKDLLKLVAVLLQRIEWKECGNGFLSISAIGASVLSRLANSHRPQVPVIIYPLDWIANSVREQLAMAKQPDRGKALLALTDPAPEPRRSTAVLHENLDRHIGNLVGKAVGNPASHPPLTPAWRHFNEARG